MYDDEALFFKIMLRFSTFITSQGWDKYRQHPGSFCERAIRDGLWDRNPDTLTPDKGRLFLWQRQCLNDSSCPADDRVHLLLALDQRMEALGMVAN